MQHTTHYLSTYMKRAAVFGLSGVLALSLCPGFGTEQPEAYAVTAAEKQAEAEAALANLTAMQETLDRLSMEYGEALEAQAEAEEKRDAAQVRIGEIEERKTELQGRLSERAREMYRNGSISYLDMLLGASSFEDFATSWDMLNKVNDNDAGMVEEQKALQAEAVEQHAILTEQAEVAAQKSLEAEEAEQQAAATVGEMQATYDSLSAEAAQLLEEERKAREAEEAARAAAIVAESAAAAERAQREAAAGGAGTTATATDDNGTTTTATNNGDGTTTTTTTATDGTTVTQTEETKTYDASTDVVAAGPTEGGSDTVSRAYSCLGCDYVWGGVGPGGYDCSGLVSFCLTGEHTRLGTTSTFMGWPQVSDPQPGDIAVNWGHTGVYIGGGQMIHAATYGVGVIIGPVQSGMIIVRWQG